MYTQHTVVITFVFALGFVLSGRALGEGPSYHQKSDAELVAEASSSGGQCRDCYGGLTAYEDCKIDGLKGIIDGLWTSYVCTNDNQMIWNCPDEQFALITPHDEVKACNTGLNLRNITTPRDNIDSDVAVALPIDDIAEGGAVSLTERSHTWRGSTRAVKCEVPGGFKMTWRSDGTWDASGKRKCTSPRLSGISCKTFDVTVSFHTKSDCSDDPIATPKVAGGLMGPEKSRDINEHGQDDGIKANYSRIKCHSLNLSCRTGF